MDRAKNTVNVNLQQFAATMIQNKVKRRKKKRKRKKRKKKRRRINSSSTSSGHGLGHIRDIKLQRNRPWMGFSGSAVSIRSKHITNMCMLYTHMCSAICIYIIGCWCWCFLVVVPAYKHSSLLTWDSFHNIHIYVCGTASIYLLYALSMYYIYVLSFSIKSIWTPNRPVCMSSTTTTVPNCLDEPHVTLLPPFIFCFVFFLLLFYLVRINYRRHTHICV